jgi:hypothetical protein
MQDFHHLGRLGHRLAGLQREASWRQASGSSAQRTADELMRRERVLLGEHVDMLP